MKILLIYPDNTRGRFKPMGIALLSAVAKNCGHEVSIFDQSDYVFDTFSDHAGVDLLLFKRFKYPEHLKYEPVKNVKTAFKEVVESFKPDLLAFSVTYLLFKNAIELVRSLESRKVRTIFGGIHVTLNPEEVIAHDDVDMICCGEGEDAFKELINAMERHEDISSIPNIWVKKNGQVHKNPMRPLRTTLDDLPLSDWSVFPNHHFYKPYVGRIYRAGDIIVSRGCYNSCTYCYYHAYYKAYNSRKHRVLFMSPERAVSEVENLVGNYGVNLIKFRDADFTARPVEQIREMAYLINEMGPRKPKLLCNVYHRSVSYEKVRYMREMNMVSVTMGLESGSEELRRKYLGRRASIEKFYDACRWFRQNGIRLCTGNMIGLPSETRDQIFKTIRVNKKGKVDLADVSILYPFPGTRIHEICKELGFLKRELSEQTYYRGEPVLDMPQISRTELQGLMRTFQLYMNSSEWMYPIIRLAEEDSPMGRAYLHLLQELFYPYIFWIKPTLKKLAGFWQGGINGKRQ